MRDDMARVIVERPRIPAFKSRKGRRRAFEDLPTHEGLRRAQSLRGDRKQMNESLGPLRATSSARSAGRGTRSMPRSPRGCAWTTQFSNMCGIICVILLR